MSRNLSLTGPSLIFALCAAACGHDADSSGEGTTTDAHLFVTSSVVLTDLGQDTYISLLPDLESRELDLDDAREFAGWAGIWTHENKLFISDGESPELTRFDVDAKRRLKNDGSLSFLNTGAGFADSTFVAADKAYVFADDGVAWNPKTLEIGDDFRLPEIDDRPGGMQYQGLRSGRRTVVRGNRAYVATGWANWDEYDVAEDSLIVVIDTEKDEVVDVLKAECPYLDVATLDDAGNVYFSNWVYSLGQTLLNGHRKACAVRIREGEDRLDADWSLTFADVTDGREAAAMRYVGDGEALISVFHHERVELSAETDPAALSDGANWQFWLLDLDSRKAKPIEEMGFHAGGFNMAHVNEQAFVLVPTADYSSTRVYHLAPNGSAELRWETLGWSTELLKLR